MLRSAKKHLKGFTLIELVVVLVIIALLASGSIAMIIASLNRASYARTNEKMDTVQLTLLNFAKAKGYLPCPADITQSALTSALYGIGVGTGLVSANCSAANFSDGYTVAGLLPVRTLNLDDSYALDGFNRPLLYVVDSRLTVANAATLYPLGSGVGSITVKDDAGGTRASDAVYALISLGSDGHGAYSANGGTARRNVHASNPQTLQNCHCNTDGTSALFDSTFVQMKESGDQSQNAGYFFDHTVRFAKLFDFSGSGTIATSSSASSSASGSSSSGGCPPSCIGAGGACSGVGDCCVGLKCSGGTCTSCVAPPYASTCTCSGNVDCLSGNCVSGLASCKHDYCSSSSSSASSASSGSSSSSGGSSAGGSSSGGACVTGNCFANGDCSTPCTNYCGGTPTYYGCNASLEQRKDVMYARMFVPGFSLPEEEKPKMSMPSTFHEICSATVGATVGAPDADAAACLFPPCCCVCTCSGSSGSSGGCTSCISAGQACTGPGQCCDGLSCSAGVCTACSGPPYVSDCGCTSDNECIGSPGSAQCTAGSCPGIGYCAATGGGGGSSASSSSGGSLCNCNYYADTSFGGANCKSGCDSGRGIAEPGGGGSHVWDNINTCTCFANASAPGPITSGSPCPSDIGAGTCLIWDNCTTPGTPIDHNPPSCASSASGGSAGSSGGGSCPAGCGCVSPTGSLCYGGGGCDPAACHSGYMGFYSGSGGGTVYTVSGSCTDASTCQMTWDTPVSSTCNYDCGAPSSSASSSASSSGGAGVSCACCPDVNAPSTMYLTLTSVSTPTFAVTYDSGNPVSGNPAWYSGATTVGSCTRYWRVVCDPIAGFVLSGFSDAAFTSEDCSETIGMQSTCSPLDSGNSYNTDMPNCGTTCGVGVAPTGARLTSF